MFSLILVTCAKGKSNKPKKKILKCDALVTSLILYPDLGDGKVDFSAGAAMNISDIISIRLGSEIDPESVDADGKPKQRRQSLMSGWFSKVSDSDGFLYGTANLRRNVKGDEMAWCLAIFLKDRYSF